MCVYKCVYNKELYIEIKINITIYFVLFHLENRF